MSKDDVSNFPQGVVVFFRAIGTDGSMARSIHLTGRQVAMGRYYDNVCHEDDYVVVDANDKLLGCYPREYVSAILPVETVGPGAPPDAGNQQKFTQN